MILILLSSLLPPLVHPSSTHPSSTHQPPDRPQVCQELQLGNFEPVFDLLEAQFPVLRTQRHHIKQIFHEIQDQLTATNEAIVLLSHELSHLYQLHQQLVALSVLDITGRARLTLLITKHLLTIPVTMRDMTFQQQQQQQQHHHQHHQHQPPHHDYHQQPSTIVAADGETPTRTSCCYLALPSVELVLMEEQQQAQLLHCLSHTADHPEVTSNKTITSATIANPPAPRTPVEPRDFSFLSRAATEESLGIAESIHDTLNKSIRWLEDIHHEPSPSLSSSPSSSSSSVAPPPSSSSSSSSLSSSVGSSSWWPATIVESVAGGIRRRLFG